MSFLFVLQMMAAWYGIVIFVVWLVAVMVFGKAWRIRNITLTVLILSLLPLIYLFGDQPEAIRRQNAEAEDLRKRYVESKAEFDELCKGAGIKVYRKPEKVDGVLLRMQKMPQGMDWDDQFFPPAALASARIWEVQVGQLLHAERTDSETKGDRGFFERDFIKGSIKGFKWVEMERSEGGERIRYVSNRDANDAIREITADTLSPRYAIDINFDVDPTRRHHWIAGAYVDVIDLKQGAVIASYRKFSMDPGQGDSRNGRSPWVRAAAERHMCPASNQVAGDAEVRVFVSDLFSFEKVN